jgi:cytoskeletal protein CcmA (bactofilin family)
MGLNTQDRAIQKDAAPEGTLIVGKGIRFKGEISACNCLVVEGEVEATITTQRLVVAKDGRFQGTAKVKTAEVAGSLVGKLEVTDMLVIKRTGRVAGACQYQRISIEDGGAISGDINSQSNRLESISAERTLSKSAS